MNIETETQEEKEALDAIDSISTFKHTAGEWDWNSEAFNKAQLKRKEIVDSFLWTKDRYPGVMIDLGLVNESRRELCECLKMARQALDECAPYALNSISAEDLKRIDEIINKYEDK